MTIMNYSPYVIKESRSVSHKNQKITVKISVELTWGENFTSYGVSNQFSFSEATEKALQAASNKLRLAIRRRDDFRHCTRKIPLISIGDTAQKKDPKLVLDTTIGLLFERELPKKLPRCVREKLEHGKLDLELHAYFGRNKEEAEREEHRILDQELKDYFEQKRDPYISNWNSYWNSSGEESWDEYVEDWDY